MSSTAFERRSLSQRKERSAAPDEAPAARRRQAERRAGKVALRVWVVPHTHWDREWYLPFEQFRIHLARMMDDLLDALETEPSLLFTLDGQAILLEDYLELRPENEERLRRLIAAGRIAIGPSYVLPDEFLSGPEALVRNLLIGRQVCLRQGGPPMAVAYAPDTFGHVAQMPQILRGFGIDSFVFWRGLGDEAKRLGSVFQWEASDGSGVLAIRIHEGYASARDLGRWTRREGWVQDDPALWPERAAARVAEFLERWREPIERSGLRDVLMGNGVDHQPIQRDLPRMLAACGERLPGLSFQIATYEGYVDALRWRVKDLQTHAGELAGGLEACVTRSVNSTRIYLKQANEAAERALFVAEVLASLARLRTKDSGLRTKDSGLRTKDADVSTQHSALSTCHSLPLPLGERERARGHVHGGEGATPVYRYPLNELRLAWRELLRNHPHDSLPGCSLDEAHLDMLHRFRKVRQIAAEVQREALAAMAGRVAGMRAWEEDGSGCTVVNPLPWGRVRAVEIEVPPELARARSLVAETAAGDQPVQVVGKGVARRAVVASRVPGFGTSQLRLRQGDSATPAKAPSWERGHLARPGFVQQHEASPPRTRALGSRAIENEFYRVAVEGNGTITVTDRRTARQWAGLLWFEDVADRGDEYSFCPLEGDIPLDTRSLLARSRVTAAGPVAAELEILLHWHLPRSLAPGRRRRLKTSVACPIRTIVRLVAGVDRIEFSTTIDNRARDHRLRVVFAAPESSPAVQAEGHFAVLRRPALPEWNGEWREPPTKTHHTLGLVAAGRLALMTRGLPEYEAIPNESGGVDLALTLLRCVGWLSWSDLATRPGAEDPHIPTPDAQCPGRHTFEYALSLQGERTEAELVRAAQDYRVAMAVGPEGGDLEGVLAAEGEGFGFSALKGAEDGNGVILRLYNPGTDERSAVVGGRGLAVRRCRLDETGTEAEAAETVRLRGGEIVTMRLTPSP